MKQGELIGNREIKFRAWMGEYNEFFYFDLYDLQQNPDYYGDALDELLMQYTGLKDKNGKEIYEGDIALGRSYGAEFKEVVHMICGGYAPYTAHNEDAILVFDHSPMESEIIGNIFENPELL